MKKKILVLCMCLILTSGCGKQIPKLKNGEEAVVTINEKNKISVDELYYFHIITPRALYKKCHFLSTTAIQHFTKPD